jgi:hypothetical protein
VATLLQTGAARVLIPTTAVAADGGGGGGGGTVATVVAPRLLPVDALVVLLPCNSADLAQSAIAAAAAALKHLGLEGDGRDYKAWGVPQAPVIFDGGDAPTDAIDALLGVLATSAAEPPALKNWGVAALPPPEDADTTLEALLAQFPTATFVVPTAVGCALAQMGATAEGAAELATMSGRGGRFVTVGGDGGGGLAARGLELVERLPAGVGDVFSGWLEVPHFWGRDECETVISVDVRMVGLGDGSPSTQGVDGQYSGEWDLENHRPHGWGVMRWDNGITYEGGWADGLYHGQGRKTYSKGGGYDGRWREGRRSGLGTSIYDGKFGYDRWEGAFEDDAPHGVGVMYTRCKEGGGAATQGVSFEFVHGQPTTE